MNFKTTTITTALAAVAMTTISIVSAQAPAHAAKLFFTPAGNNIDSDPIADLVLTPTLVPPTGIKFDIFLDTTGLTKTIDELQYTYRWDALEILTTGSTINPQPTAPFETRINTTDFAANSGTFLLESVFFAVGSNLPNDGVRDFQLTLNEVFSKELRRNDQRFNLKPDFVYMDPQTVGRQLTQRVEVQAVPTPALLPGLIAMGVGMLRKRKAEAVES